MPEMRTDRATAWAAAGQDECVRQAECVPQAECVRQARRGKADGPSRVAIGD